MPDELRPAEILEMFWREQLVIEETALFLNPVYIQEVRNAKNETTVNSKTQRL
jgi:hypothetical protein